MRMLKSEPLGFWPLLAVLKIEARPHHVVYLFDDNVLEICSRTGAFNPADHQNITN
jgi:hypothetical protein